MDIERKFSQAVDETESRARARMVERAREQGNTFAAWYGFEDKDGRPSSVGRFEIGFAWGDDVPDPDHRAADN